MKKQTIPCRLLAALLISACALQAHEPCAGARSALERCLCQCEAAYEQHKKSYLFLAGWLRSLCRTNCKPIPRAALEEHPPRPGALQPPSR